MRRRIRGRVSNRYSELLIETETGQPEIKEALSDSENWSM
jgi:hypothetical protein